MINAQLSTGLFGEYRLIVKRQNQIVRDTGWFKNLILDSGLDFFGNTSEPLSTSTAYYFCKVGTGSIAPSFGQTGLQNQIAEISLASVTITDPPPPPDYIIQHTAFYNFPIGGVLGTIAEIGVGWVSGSGSLFSRALILDGSGNPVTISLTPIDQLQVYYRLNFVPSATDFSGSFTVAGTTYTYTGRRANISGFVSYAYPKDFNGASGSDCIAYGTDFALGPITGFPTGTSLGTNTSKTFNNYITSNYYLDITYTWARPNANATGGIKGLVVNIYNGNNFQVLLNQGIPKNNTRILNLVIRNSWNRL
jgi:hypothetical protein